ncbi:MAG: 30S ribosomal protein S1 [Deltaproteobacteria bacterium]|nr:MAG: 30S ribosomal protein S1 [Deltaproteobacteria bacterium]
MTVQNGGDGFTSEERFEDLFEAYNRESADMLCAGDTVEGKVIAVGADTVYVDTGTKIDGAVDKKELLDDDGNCTVAVGDTVSLYVVSATEDEVILSKALSGRGGTDAIATAHATGTPVEGRVAEVCKGGFRVRIAGKLAFCPISQMDVAFIEQAEDYVDKSFTFIVKRFEENGRNIVVSRRELLEAERNAARAAFFDTLEIGAVMDGRVAKVMPYGLFVELVPGVEGMVHVSEISWSRVSDPSEAAAAGDAVRVKVLSVGQAEGGKAPRIALSMKQTEDDPWSRVADTLKAGMQVEGTVARCTDFGAFVEVMPGVEGLVHISEISYVKRVTRPEDEAPPGTTVFVSIKDVDLQKKRLSLSIRDAKGDPWADAATRYPAGKPVRGTVEKVERFGLFVSLEPGVTGLLPRRRLQDRPEGAAVERLKPGAQIEVTVLAVDMAARKMELGLAEADAEGEMTTWKEAPASNGFGDLGEKLMAAMQKQKP